MKRGGAERGENDRRRRLRDALRLLPILGVMLWMLPLFWPSGPEIAARAVPMSRAILYIFVVWLLLVLAAFLLSRPLIGDTKRAERKGDRS